jgi:LysM repeat protein
MPVTALAKFTTSLVKLNNSEHKFITWTPYTFKKGDTLKRVSENHAMSVKKLAKVNGINSRHKYMKGTKLIVPTLQPSKQNLFAELNNFIRPKLIRSKNFYRSNSYRVQRGDSLSEIAKKYRTTVKEIKKLNGLNSNLIIAGDRLKILSTAQSDGIHRVKRGDSLYSIAIRYRTSVSELKRINRLATDIIIIGAKLVIQ